jgi:two-component system LytT family response regulator
MSLIKCLIVDDEEIARSRVQRLISEYPDLMIVGEAENGIEAVEKINDLNPDLVFLDIQMPGLNGFDVLKKLDKQPVIIFTTAYDKFAIRAFEENAIAYLLKPIEQDKFNHAINKSKALLQNPDKILYEKLSQFIENKSFTHFVSKFGSKVKFIPKEDVCIILARDKYTFIHLLDGNEYIIDHTLSKIETYMGESFLRIHRSTIINRNHISEAEKAGDGRYLFTLKDVRKSQVQSSASYSQAIRHCLGI